MKDQARSSERPAVEASPAGVEPVAPRHRTPADHVLDLQRTIGNRRVSALLDGRGAAAARGVRAVSPLAHAPAPVAQRVQADAPPAATIDAHASSEAQPLQRNATAEPARRTNTTGLPDHLKAGIESLSGYSMDDVKVHYNSSEPARIQALAYTRGSDIHMGPGQEKHLPHEAWHVVQQKQGRVAPTTQAKGEGGFGSAAINDDPGLEREADTMGTLAMRQGRSTPVSPAATADASQRQPVEAQSATASSGEAITRPAITNRTDRRNSNLARSPMPTLDNHSAPVQRFAGHLTVYNDVDRLLQADPADPEELPAIPFIVTGSYAIAIRSGYNPAVPDTPMRQPGDLDIEFKNRDNLQDAYYRLEYSGLFEGKGDVGDDSQTAMMEHIGTGVTVDMGVFSIHFEDEETVSTGLFACFGCGTTTISTFPQASGPAPLEMLFVGPLVRCDEVGKNDVSLIQDMISTNRADVGPGFITRILRYVPGQDDKQHVVARWRLFWNGRTVKTRQTMTAPGMLQDLQNA